MSICNNKNSLQTPLQTPLSMTLEQPLRRRAPLKKKKDWWQPSSLFSSSIPRFVRAPSDHELARTKARNSPKPARARKNFFHSASDDERRRTGHRSAMVDRPVITQQREERNGQRPSDIEARTGSALRQIRSLLSYASFITQRGTQHHGEQQQWTTASSNRQGKE